MCKIYRPENTSNFFDFCYYLFHDGGSYHIETSPLIFSASQWAGFYMIETPVIKELIFSLYSASPLVNVVEKVSITNRTAICSDDSQLVPTMSPPPTGYVDAQQGMNVRLALYSFLYTLLLLLLLLLSL